MAGLGTIKKSYRANVSNMKYAMLTSDTKEACTYGTVKDFAGPQEITITPEVATGKLYLGGKKAVSESEITGYKIDVKAGKVQQDVQADIFNFKFTEDGVMIVDGDMQSKEFALGIEIEQSGGGKECIWLLKCTAQPYAFSVKQREGNIDYSTDSITIEAMAREFDGVFELIGDTNNATFTKAKAAAFFDAVPTTVTAEAVSAGASENQGS